MSRRSLLNLIIPAAILFAAPALAENRLALVIGQSAYKSVPALPNPANDAKAVSQLLSDSGFASQVAAKGSDTVALVFYAGHGLQIDGENYLVPVDVDPKREADIPIQAVRLNDILNTLNSVPSKMRILLLDACRNNPFPELNKTAGHGLALVDTKIGAPGTFLSFSTSPGAEAEDGDGANSPYTTALLAAAKDPAPIEDTFKRVRLSVNKVTEGRQTPWDSSSLTDDFRFVAGPAGANAAVTAPKLASTKRTVDEWKRELQGKPVDVANELIVVDGTDEAYDAFAALYASTPRGLQARDWLDRHRRMVAWNNAVIINTAAGYRAFLAQYPDSDLSATARKLEERLRNRPAVAAVVAAPVSVPAANVALAAPTCPCNTAPAPLKKVDLPVKKRVDPNPPKRASAPPRQVVDEEVVVVRRPPPREVYEPSGPPVGIGIGIGIGGGGYGGREGGWQGRRGGY
jgi:uncharacterized caspase-like protein